VLRIRIAEYYDQSQFAPSLGEAAAAQPHATWREDEGEG